MALLGPKKDGGPNTEFFQSPESMQGFEQVRQWLQKNCKKVSIRRVAAIPHIYICICNTPHDTHSTHKNNSSIPAILKTKQNI